MLCCCRTRRPKRQLVIATIAACMIGSFLWSMSSFREDSITAITIPRHETQLAVHPLADLPPKTTRGEINLLLHDEYLINRFWGPGHGAKWIREGQSEIQSCDLQSRCSLRLVSRSSQNKLPKASSISQNNRAAVIVAVGDSGKLNRRDLDRGFDFARKFVDRDSPPPAVAVLLTEGNLDRARSAARFWRRSRWGSPGVAQRPNQAQRSSNQQQQLEAKGANKLASGSDSIRGAASSNRLATRGAAEPSANPPAGPALVELSGDKRARLWLPPACPAWRRMRDELQQRFNGLVGVTALVVSLPARPEPGHRPSELGLLETSLGVSPLRRCSHAALYWQAVRSWLIAMVRERGWSSAAIHGPWGIRGRTVANTRQRTMRAERAAFLQCARGLVQAQGVTQSGSSIASNTKQSNRTRSQWIRWFSGPAAEALPGLPWRVGACAVTAALEGYITEIRSDGQPAGDERESACSTASYGLVKVVEYVSQLSSANEWISRAGAATGDGTRQQAAATIDPFRPHKRTIPAISLVSNCRPGRDAVLAAMGSDPTSMVHLGKCPRSADRSAGGAGGFRSDRAGSLPQAAAPAHALHGLADMSRHADAWWDSKLQAARQARHLFAFEPIPTGYVPEGPARSDSSSTLEGNSAIQSMQRAVEDAERQGYVSEKVLDAVAAGAVPLFHGAAATASTMLPASVQELGAVWWDPKQEGTGRRGDMPGSGVSWNTEGALGAMIGSIRAGPSALRMPADVAPAGPVSSAPSIEPDESDPEPLHGRWNGSAAGLFLSRYAGWRLGHLGPNGSTWLAEPDNPQRRGKAAQDWQPPSVDRYAATLCSDAKHMRPGLSSPDACVSNLKSLLIAEGEAASGMSLLHELYDPRQGHWHGLPWLAPLLELVDQQGVCSLGESDPLRQARLEVARACSRSKWCRLCEMMIGAAGEP